MQIVGMYLFAIVAANVTVALWGPGVSVVNAFLFIGFNLTARDKLHNAWRGRNLKRNMAVLITTGSLLSFALGAKQIAVASFVAFALSETVDALVFHALARRSKLVQVNGSNVVSAAVDSVAFPLLAFGWPPLLGIMLAQFVAKVFGGALWGWALRKQ